VQKKRKEKITKTGTVNTRVTEKERKEGQID
jgi:hypothetical protein